MKAFTLDTNCLIDVEQGAPPAVAIRTLQEAAKNGAVDLALVASSASERQVDGGFLGTFSDFQMRCQRVGFGEVSFLPSIGRHDVSFFDKCLWASSDALAREAAIFSALFSGHQIEWVDFAAAVGVDPEERNTPHFKKWRNRMLDAQAFWAHDRAGRDIFVTSDRNFRKLEGHSGFPGAVVRSPQEAAALL